MGKRHHATRRKTYGRRQHELREREHRRNGRDVLDDVLVVMGWEHDTEPGSATYELAARVLRFATSD
jgi:hypothetical protein